jgi:hypothetical protein
MVKHFNILSTVAELRMKALEEMTAQSPGPLLGRIYSGL